jgi:hypothetical protein
VRRWVTGKDADPLRYYATKTPAAARGAPRTTRAGGRLARLLAIGCAAWLVAATGAVLGQGMNGPITQAVASGQWGTPHGQDARGTQMVGLGQARGAEVALPQPKPTEPVTITAQSAVRWIQGEYEVWVLQGGCRIEQGATRASGNEAVVWIDRNDLMEIGPEVAIVYFEGQVRVENMAGGRPSKIADDSWWLGRFTSSGSIKVQVPQVSGPPQTPPPIYARGMARRMPTTVDTIRRTQYTQFSTEPELTPVGPPPLGARRLHVHPRSNVDMEFEWRNDPGTDRWVAVVNFGVNVIVEGVSETGVLDISADRVVIWMVAAGMPNLSGGVLQAENVPLEFYLEGNIAFREGARVIYADRMYYDVRNKVGMVLGADLLAPVPNYEGLLRLRTEMLQQTGEGQFHAQNGFLTSSRLGKPSYRMQIGDVSFKDSERPVIDPATGVQGRDPATGEPLVEREQLATGKNGLLYMGDVPVFYWPTFTSDLKDPSLYVRRVRLKHDGMFGTQVLTNWNGYQLLGLKPPAGDDWDLSLDWLSDRGLGHGTAYTYQRDGFWIFSGQTAGLIDYWGIEDHGHDNLGRDQRDLVPEKKYRWRWFWQHRQMLPYDWRLSSELGWISDRNFLNQYYEREWEELKDESTGIELKRESDNVSYSITTDTRLNAFFTQTEWYPRADHYWLGQPLLGDALTWYEHSSVGYGRYRILSYPENQAQRDMFRYMPWEIAEKGERLVTTQELDWPFQLGPVKTVPYALGQLAHWGKDLNGEDLQRAYYQVGVRGSVPIWRVDPTAESELWNVHGLAHKVVFDAEFSFAEANRDVNLLPLYDAMDDDSIEYFRRRMPAVTYGTQALLFDYIPPRFDPRSYAIRSGLASWVTSPSAEVLDDLMAMRMGVRQRWQTKRGVPGQRKIIDWITLDANATWFPDAQRDNFDKSLGLVDYDFRWHVGDRLTLVSDGIFDFFNEGQQIVSIGGFLNRPPRGDFYMGLRLLQGPIDSQILSMSYNYWMSPKWVSTFGTSVDLGKEGNIGQRLVITRIGEALLVSVGFNVDASRGNVGAMFAVEPRFLPKTRLGQSSGVHIPVAGAYGLE